MNSRTPWWPPFSSDSHVLKIAPPLINLVPEKEGTEDAVYFIPY
jgi:hypothetical protein